MTLPANIRVNVAAPFPTIVQGSAFVTIAKANGIWTIGANGRLITTQNPGIVATDYVMVWDDLAQTWLKISLANLITQAGTARTQRSVTASPITVASQDQIINVNINGGSPACTLPGYASRGGVPVTFKDVGGHFNAHNLTITAAGGELIDGNASIVLTQNFQAVTLVPANDTVNTGWSIE